MAAVAAIIGVGSAIYQGVSQSQAQNTEAQATLEQGQYARTISVTNSMAASTSAAGAIQAGDINAERLQMGAGVTMGAEKASYGAQGVEATSGSAASMEESTSKSSVVDADQIKLNSWYQAFGIHADATNELQQGQFSMMKAQAGSTALGMAANTSLVTGGLNAANQYLGYEFRESMLSSGKPPNGYSSFPNSFS